jgi:radical SAM superfamily enzyme YgiQ (UPF0313 family)
VDVGVLDCKFDRLEYRQAMDRIRDCSRDLVGFTAFTNEVIQAGRLAAMAKQWRPSAMTVIGGVHVSALPDRTLREFPQFDYAVLGEGEQTLLELVRSLEQEFKEYRTKYPEKSVRTECWGIVVCKTPLRFTKNINKVSLL